MVTLVRAAGILIVSSVVVAGCGRGPVDTRSALPPGKAAPDLIRLVPPSAPADWDSAVPRPRFGEGVAGLLVDAEPKPDRPDLNLVAGHQGGRRLDA